MTEKSQEYMRKRTHGKESRQRQEVYEERVDEQLNLRKYSTAILF